MKKRLLLLVICMVLLANIFAGCATDTKSQPHESETASGETETTERKDETPSEEDLPILRVAVMPSYYSSMMYYASEQGWDVEEGFKMEFISFTTGAPMNEALAADLWDVAGIGLACINALAQYDAKYLCEIYLGTSTDLIIRADSDIAAASGTFPDNPGILGSVETIKGKTVLAAAGTLAQYHVAKWLELHGLSLSDINFVNMDFTQAYQAFLTGEGDIACLRSPEMYKAIEDHGMVSAGNLSLVAPVYEQIICSAGAYENMRELLKKFIKLQFRAQEYFLQHDDEALEVYSEWYELNGYEASEDIKEIFEIQIKEHPFLTFEEALSTDFGAAIIASAEFMVSEGQLEPEMLETVKSSLKPDLIRELAEEMGL